MTSWWFSSPEIRHISQPLKKSKQECGAHFCLGDKPRKRPKRKTPSRILIMEFLEHLKIMFSYFPISGKKYIENRLWYMKLIIFEDWSSNIGCGFCFRNGGLSSWYTSAWFSSSWKIILYSPLWHTQSCVEHLSKPKSWHCTSELLSL